MSNLKEQYEKIVNKYTDRFCKKHGLELDFWVADDIGGVAMLGDYFFSFNDIRLDIDTNQKKEAIFEWYEIMLESNVNINYYNWIKGFRGNKLCPI